MTTGCPTCSPPTVNGGANVTGQALPLARNPVEKMKPASYRNIEAPEIPVVDLKGGGRAKVIAGTLDANGLATTGPVSGISTDPMIVDVALPAAARFELPIAAGRNAFLYVFEGSVAIGPDGASRALGVHRTGILSDGDTVAIAAGNDGGRFLLLAGRPLNEPIVQYGPFVMNTREEIMQAMQDYRRTEFGGWPWPDSAPVHGGMPRRFARYPGAQADTLPGE